MRLADFILRKFETILKQWEAFAQQIHGPHKRFVMNRCEKET